MSRVVHMLELATSYWGAGNSGGGLLVVCLSGRHCVLQDAAGLDGRSLARSSRGALLRFNLCVCVHKAPPKSFMTAFCLHMEASDSFHVLFYQQHLRVQEGERKDIYSSKGDML